MLFFDQRPALEGKPGLHALIVGISKYPNLTQEDMNSYGISQNSSSAITGYEIFKWIMSRRDLLAVPLATCRVMLSPSSEEIEAEPRLKDMTVPCGVQDFLRAANEWRLDAKAHQKNMTLFYFAGNGFELSQSNPVILLEDYGSGIGPVLRSSVSVNNIFYGMAPTDQQRDIARTQLYFVDTDRVASSRFSSVEQMNTTAIFDAVPLGVDDRQAVVFYASTPGSVAYAYPGRPTLFSIALFKCLEGAAAVPEDNDEGHIRWQVSILSLVDGLDAVLPDLNQKIGAKQTFAVSGLVRDSTLLYLKAPPLVDLTIRIDPEEARPVTRVELRDEEGTLILALDPPLQSEYNKQVPAGFYTLSARIDPPDSRYKDLPMRAFMVKPPRFNWKVSVIS